MASLPRVDQEDRYRSVHTVCDDDACPATHAGARNEPHIPIYARRPARADISLGLSSCFAFDHPRHLIPCGNCPTCPAHARDSAHATLHTRLTHATHTRDAARATSVHEAPSAKPAVHHTSHPQALSLSPQMALSRSSTDGLARGDGAWLAVRLHATTPSALSASITRGPPPLSLSPSSLADGSLGRRHDRRRRRSNRRSASPTRARLASDSLRFNEIQ